LSQARPRKKFQKCLPESTHQAWFGPKPLKRRVQNSRHFPEKFENRLLGPTNYLNPVTELASFLFPTLPELGTIWELLGSYFGPTGDDWFSLRMM
jgi:hypothetical protein